MKYQLIRVPPTSPVELKHRVYRLRHTIYVGELGYSLQTEAGLLLDELDDRSTNLLVSWGGQDIGTIRYTKRSDGLLETEGQSSEWAAHIAACPAQNVSELTRLMVTKQHRGRGATPFLLSGVMQEWARDETESCFFAAKPGAPTRFWLGFYAKIADTTLAQYRIGDFSPGVYQLMSFDKACCYKSLQARLERLSGLH